MKIGKSMANPKTKGVADDEEQELARAVTGTGEDALANQNKSTPIKNAATNKKLSTKKAVPGEVALSDEKSASIGKNTHKILRNKLLNKDDDRLKNGKPRTKEQEKRYALKRLNMQLPQGYSYQNKASYLYMKLESMRLFEETDQPTNIMMGQRTLLSEVEETYRNIYNSVQSTGEKGETIDKSEQHKSALKNMKMKKSILVAYLRKRYASRLA